MKFLRICFSIMVLLCSIAPQATALTPITATMEAPPFPIQPLLLTNRSYRDRLFAKPFQLCMNPERDEILVVEQQYITVFNRQLKPVYGFNPCYGSEILLSVTVIPGTATLLAIKMSPKFRDFHFEVIDYQGRKLYNFLGGFGLQALPKIIPSPTRVRIHKNIVFVLDNRLKRVYQFDLEGNLIRWFGPPPDKPESLKMPVDIVITDDDEVFILDRSDNKAVVKVFTIRGRFLRSFGQHGIGDLAFSAPNGMGMDRYKNLWIVDQIRNLVKAITPEGKYLEFFGGKGTGRGQMYYPVDVEIDADRGIIYLLEGHGKRLQALQILEEEPEPTPPPAQLENTTRAAEPAAKSQ